jgi:hypothetical protein
VTLVRSTSHALKVLFRRGFFGGTFQKDLHEFVERARHFLCIASDAIHRGKELIRAKLKGDVMGFA